MLSGRFSLVMGGGKLTTLGLALMVLLCACGRISASTPSTSSSAGGLSFNCSLPVSTYSWSGGITLESGFISVPSGTFTPDPSAKGYVTYERTTKRWLPVVAAQVTPDGSMYAYEMELPNAYEIHVVQVANGADKMIRSMPYNDAYSILAMKPEGIYMVPILHRSGVPVGLWLLSSTRATLTAVPGAGTSQWQVIEGGAAWGGPVGGDRVDRLDLSSGVVTTWFIHATAVPIGIGSSYGPSVVGFDTAGRPLVEVYPPVDTAASPARTDPAPELWLASTPDRASRLSGLPIPFQDSGSLQPGVTDSHGTWFVGLDGFYLYTDSGFRRAAPLPPTGNFSLAGGCA